LLACLTDNIEHGFFLASELSMEKNCTRQVACVSYFINTYFGCCQLHSPSMGFAINISQ